MNWFGFLYAFIVCIVICSALLLSIKLQKNAEQTSPANHRPFETSGTASADSAARAEAMPEASGDS